MLLLPEFLPKPDDLLPMVSYIACLEGPHRIDPDDTTLILGGLKLRYHFFAIYVNQIKRACMGMI